MPMRRAFTLVELLLVIVIIAIIAAIAIPMFGNSSTRSKESALRGDLKLLRNAITEFHNDTGCFPSQASDLTSTTKPPNCKSASDNLIQIPAGTFQGPYISNIPTDPIDGSAFNYDSFHVGSIGKVWANSGTASDGTNYSNW